MKESKKIQKSDQQFVLVQKRSINLILFVFDFDNKHWKMYKFHMYIVGRLKVEDHQHSWF